MQINFKFVLIPLSFIILCGNSIIYSMEYYDNAMLNNELLNDTQINFITEISNKVYNSINDINDYYEKMKLSNSLNKINKIKNEYFDKFVCGYFKSFIYKTKWSMTPIDIFAKHLVNKLKFNNKDEYLTFITRIKECYNQKLIDKEHYISLLSYLLYCNTCYIVDYLNNKINEMKSDTHSTYDSVMKSNITYTIANFATQLIETFKSGYFYKDSSITDFVNSCIDNAPYNNKEQNNYALTYSNYKDIMKSIIEDLIPLLMPNNQQVFNVKEKLEIVAEQIIEPIKLGIYCHAFKEVYTKYNINGSILYQKGLLDINSPDSCYKTILSSPQTIEQIDKDFNITQLIKSSKEYKTFINRYDEVMTYTKFMYDKKNDMEKNIPFGSVELFKEKVKHLEDNSKLSEERRTTYKHSTALIDVANGKKDSSAGGNNFEVTKGIMKYVTKTTVPESIQKDIKNKLNDINNNKAHDNNINIINYNEPKDNVNTTTSKKKIKGKKKKRDLDY